MDKELKALLKELGVSEDVISAKEDLFLKFEDSTGLKKNRDDLLAENKRLKSKNSEDKDKEIESLLAENSLLKEESGKYSKLSKDFEKIKAELEGKSKALKDITLDNAVKTAISKYNLDPDETTEIVLKHKYVKFDDKGELKFGDKDNMDEFFTEFVKTDSAKRMLKADSLPTDSPMFTKNETGDKKTERPSFTGMKISEKVDYIKNSQS